MGTRSAWSRVARSALLIPVFAFLGGESALEASPPIRVLVWDEQQPRQKRAYPNFLGAEIAAQLAKSEEFSVKTARLDDPGHGISPATLQEADVLIWWGHVRQHEISAAEGREIVDRVERGELALIVLHSAHWSVPFMEAMERIAAQDALDRLPESERATATLRFLGERVRKKLAPRHRGTLMSQYRRGDDGKLEILLERPTCVFPRCCDPAEPSTVRTLLPDHPIAAGVPRRFVIPQTEMYDEPFHVPAPDKVIFEESWEDGEHFRSGALWRLGRGQVFYFRPGHETYPVFFEKPVLRIVENAARWLGDGVRAARAGPQPSALDRVLVFSKTSWYRHPEIPAVNEWLVELGKEHDFAVDVTEDANAITAENLARYQSVVLNSTTDIGKSLDDAQKAAFIAWFRSGGSIVGLHAAAVHHGTWPWFETLLGTDFSADSKRSLARVFVSPAGEVHPATAGLGTVVWLEEEWNSFTKSVRGLPGVSVLLSLDETTYDPVRPYFKARNQKPMGDDHPIAWIREFEGGRLFYTGIGHDTRILRSEFGTRHVLEALRWAAGPANQRGSAGRTAVNEDSGGGKTELATFGAGCFWCIEAVLEQLDGVEDVVSGYMGGKVANPTYEQICTGRTGHAEVVQVKFSPEKISYDDLLTMFWKLHDPTTLNRQGADVGTQYRSAIFYHSEEQQKAARASKAKAAKYFSDPIVTEITAASPFYAAEKYHQDYYRLNKNQPYCRFVIVPKLDKLGLER